MTPPTAARRRKASGLALALLAVLPFAAVPSGCGGGDLLSENNQERSELERSRLVWQNSGVRSYRFTGTLFVEPATPLRLQSRVLERAVLASELRELDTERVVEDPRVVERYGTVERMFDAIEETLDEEDSRVEVDYDPARGYPTLIAVSPTDPQIADGNVSFSVASLEVLD